MVTNILEIGKREIIMALVFGWIRKEEKEWDSGKIMH
jgi:hypothetical protein